MIANGPSAQAFSRLAGGLLRGSRDFRTGKTAMDDVQVPGGEMWSRSKFEEVVQCEVLGQPRVSLVGVSG